MNTQRKLPDMNAIKHLLVQCEEALAPTGRKKIAIPLAPEMLRNKLLCKPAHAIENPETGQVLFIFDALKLKTKILKVMKKDYNIIWKVTPTKPVPLQVEPPATEDNIGREEDILTESSSRALMGTEADDSLHNN